jgi:hypothetical protein
MDKNIVKLLNLLNAIIEKKNVNEENKIKIMEVLKVALNNIRKIK